MSAPRSCLSAAVAVIVLGGAALRAGADEKALIDQYNKIIREFNGRDYAACRKETAKFIEQAEAIKPGDAAYERAQQLLKDAREIPVKTYHNSSIDAHNKAQAATQSAQLDVAVQQWHQAVTDLTELHKLRPEKGSTDSDLAEAKAALTRCQVLQAVLAGKLPDAQLLKAASSAKPQQISDFVTAFSLPRLDEARLFTSAAVAEGGVLVVQIGSLETAGEPLFIELLRGLKKSHGERLSALTCLLTLGRDAKKLTELVKRSAGLAAVALDDGGEFRSHVLPRSLTYPAFLVVTRDRRALFISGGQPDEVAVGLCRVLAEEIGRTSQTGPRGPQPYYPKAEPIEAAFVGQGAPQALRFGARPALVLITWDRQKGNYVRMFAELARRYGAKVGISAVVQAAAPADARSFAAEPTLPLFLPKGALPACYGPQNLVRLAIVSAQGQILKVLPLSTNSDTQPVLERYIELLLTPGALPAELAEPPRPNLAYRANGGKVAKVSSAGEEGSADTLIDGQSDHVTWRSRSEAKPEITLSFLDRQPARFERILLDNPADAKDFEVLAGDEGPTGMFRVLGAFRLEKRPGLQAFALPPTSAAYVKVRLLSAYDGKTDFGLGEIAVEEVAGARPSLPERLAATYREGFEDAFSRGDFTGWHQSDFLAWRAPPIWSVRKGKLVQPRSEQSGDHRSTALIHVHQSTGDFRLEATLQGYAHAAGLLFGFRDWDNFDRLLILEGQSQVDGHAECNSIRLERWRDGRSRVLSVHGESFDRNRSLHVAVIRQQGRLAATVQGQTIINVADDEPTAVGRAGLFTSDSHGYSFEKIHLARLQSPAALTDVNPLSSAGGGSIVWVSSQGEPRDARTWAYNLLRNPVLAPPGRWEVTTRNGQAPEVVFAFRGLAEVSLHEIGFVLPSARESNVPNRVRQVELLASRGSGLDPRQFRSLGTFDLVTRDGLQSFSLPQPTPCRYLMVRLLKNGGGSKYTLARVTARLGMAPPDGAPAIVDRGQIEREFAAAPEAAEMEPNDRLDQATPVPNGKSVGATIRPGEIDLFRLPEPPKQKGRANLRLRLAALPWLRLQALVLDPAGQPLSPPLAQVGAGQVALQLRPTTPRPSFVRVEMPNASLSMVIDVSGSMSGREKDVRAAVQQFLQGVVTTEEIEVLKFSTKVVPLTPFTNNRQKLAGIPRQINMSGNTALYQALLHAMKDLGSRRGNQAIVLLSDGMNTVSGPDFADLCRKLREQPIPIYVIGVGWDLFEYDTASGNTCYDLLRNLAALTGGKYFFAPTSEQLEELYQQISGELRGETRYRLLAKWEVLDHPPELIAVATRPGKMEPFGGPLPPAPLELAAGLPGSMPPLGPAHLGQPPSPGELADSGPPPRSIVLHPGTLPSPVDLAAIVPVHCDPDTVRAPIPQPLELTTPLLPAQRLLPVPGLQPLPEFGRFTIRYRPSVGPGKADAATLPAAIRPAFEIILDSSGSMEEKVQNEPKYLVARRVMTELLSAMPDDAMVGLRMFGIVSFWKRDQEPLPDPSDKRYDTDSDLVVGIGKLDQRRRKGVKEWMEWAKPLGKTPLCYSLIQAVKDFPAEWRGPKTVILISDGMETCGGKLEDVTKAYSGTDVGLVIHVVGFDVSDPKEHEQLKAIARIGRGNFYNATNARELADALKSALQNARYVVHDEQGKTVVTDGFVNGAPLDLPAGKYRVAIPGTKTDAILVDVRGGQSLEATLDDKGKLNSPK